MSNPLSSNKLIVKFTNFNSGWVHFHLATTTTNIETAISSVPNDGLGDFLQAISTVLPFPGAQSHCEWSLEPDVLAVSLVHLPAGRLQIHIEAVSKQQTKTPSANQVQWDINCDLKKFARKVRLAYKQLLYDDGGMNYQFEWGHPFPEDAYQALSAWVIANR